MSDISEFVTRRGVETTSADELLRLMEMCQIQNARDDGIPARRTLMSESNLPGYLTPAAYSLPSTSAPRSPGVIQRPVIHDDSPRHTERSLSTATPGPLTMTSPLVTSDYTRLAVAEALLGGRRGLVRTASDPVPIMDRSMSTQPGVDSMEPSVCRYKTELCRPFEEDGKCKYGEKCQFAHGHNELRSLSRHPKYKTDRCKTYHTTGLCPYGPRCHFIHDDDDEAVVSRAHRQQLEEKLRQLKQQHLLEQQRQLQRQQQEQLLITALAQAQAAQQRRQSQLSYSDNISSPFKCAARSAQSSPHRALSTSSAFYNYPSVCNSLGSIATSSPPSSVSDSPAPSPSLSMFNGEELSSLHSSSGSTHGSVFQSRDVFSRADSWQNTPAAAPVQYPTADESFVYPNASCNNFGFTNLDSNLAGFPGSNTPSIEDVLVVAELLHAFNNAGQSSLASTLLESNGFTRGGLDFNENRFNDASCFSSSGIML